MTALEKGGKTSSLKQNSGRKRNLYDRDRRTLTQIIRKDHKNTAPKITAELNDHLGDPVSLKTVRKELHKARFRGRVVIKNLIKINLFEIPRYFHYFVQHLHIMCEWGSLRIRTVNSRIEGQKIAYLFRVPT